MCFVVSSPGETRGRPAGQRLPPDPPIFFSPRLERDAFPIGRPDRVLIVATEGDATDLGVTGQIVCPDVRLGSTLSLHGDDVAARDACVGIAALRDFQGRGLASPVFDQTT